MTPPRPPLTRESLAVAAAELGVVDPDLRRVVERLGPPPMWDRKPGFPALVRIILEQQVSLASAGAAFDKLTGKLPDLDPRSFLTLDDDTLRRIGFSGQKGRYCRELAGALINGHIDLDALTELPEDEVCSELEKVVGIGPWTSSIYLLMVLLRPDVWPHGDLALAAAAQDLKDLDERPTPQELGLLAEGWRPWRSVAARILWHHYLNPE